MRPNSINSNKKPELKLIAITAIVLSLIALFSAIALAVPNSLTLQGKLTNLAGTSQQGTFNFTFRIYDAATNGNELWASANQSITTDVNGIYDVILTGINLSFAEQYYLGIAVSSDNESAPRINLTSSPYSFRANTSEALNPNQSFVVRNLSITGNATIGDGTTILAITTQGFNFSSTTGNLNINGTITAKSYVGDGSQLTGVIAASAPQIFNSSGANVYLNDTNANLGLGLSNPSDRLVVIGNVRVSGSLNASSINTTGSAYFATSSGNVGIGTTSPNDVLEVVGNVRVSGSLNATNINASRLYARNGTVSAPSYTFIEDTNTGLRLGSADNISIVTGGSDRLTVDSSGKVGIGVTPSTLLDVGTADPYWAGYPAHIGSSADASASLVISKADNSASSPSNLFLVKYRGSISSKSALSAGDQIGAIRFTGYTNDVYDTAIIRGEADTGWGATGADSPGRIVFLTVPDGSGTLAERMRIDSAGNVGINTTTPAQTLTVQGTLNVTSQPTRSGDLFVASSGNVGIGTTAPTKKLSINGTIDAVTIDPSASPNPVINSTGNNLTISSASGSVIIRLG